MKNIEKALQNLSNAIENATNVNKVSITIVFKKSNSNKAIKKDNK